MLSQPREPLGLLWAHLQHERFVLPHVQAPLRCQGLRALPQPRQFGHDLFFVGGQDFGRHDGNQKLEVEDVEFFPVEGPLRPRLQQARYCFAPVHRKSSQVKPNAVSECGLEANLHVFEERHDDFCVDVVEKLLFLFLPVLLGHLHQNRDYFDHPVQAPQTAVVLDQLELHLLPNVRPQPLTIVVNHQHQSDHALPQQLRVVRHHLEQRLERLLAVEELPHSFVQVNVRHHDLHPLTQHPLPFEAQPDELGYLRLPLQPALVLVRERVLAVARRQQHLPAELVVELELAGGVHLGRVDEQVHAVLHFLVHGFAHALDERQLFRRRFFEDDLLFGFLLLFC